MPRSVQGHFRYVVFDSMQAGGRSPWSAVKVIILIACLIDIQSSQAVRGGR
jgi:hypothetical protein